MMMKMLQISSWQIVSNCRRSPWIGISLPEADLSDSGSRWLLLPCQDDDDDANDDDDDDDGDDNDDD